MPVYEYRCNRCRAVFEKLVRSLSSPDPVQCEKCNSSDVEKMVSAFAFSGGGNKTAPSSGGGKSACSTCSGGDCSTC